MTIAKIYSLAYNHALFNWDRWHGKLEAYPNNKIFQHREKVAWEEMEELRAIIERKGLIQEI